MILGFGSPIDLVLYQNIKKQQLELGPYVFSQINFLQLIKYVIMGGYPRWSDDIAPDYMESMQVILQQDFSGKQQ